MNFKEKHRSLIAQGIADYEAPFFFYDIDGLSAHLKMMREQTDPAIKLWYACKANPLSAILKSFLHHSYGIDVASQGELDHALRCGFQTKDILSTGPAKSRKYLKSLVEHEVDMIIIESVNQAIWLNEWAQKLGKKPQALLRVQLIWQEGKSVLGGDEITPFGIDEFGWRGLTAADFPHIDIQGFHVFQWGNILTVGQLRKIWFKITETILELAKIMQIPLNILDLGGGIGIPYTEEEKPVPYNQINDLLLETKNHFSIKNIWMELGRYAVGEFGYYASQIIDRKNVRGRDLLILEGGINHIARPALTGQGFPCQVFRTSDAPLKDFTVHGPLCTALDKLGSYKLPADVAENDWLIFSQAGAYGFTESMPFFLCHNLPAEAIIENAELKTIRNIRTSSQWLV